MRRLLITNVTIYNPFKHIENGAVLIEGSTIRFVGLKKDLIDNNYDEYIDGQGMLLTPGFVDLQLNGGFGKDFTQNPETIWEVGEKITRFGTTSFLPTIVTSPPEQIKLAQQVILDGPPDGYKGAAILGLHIEGPFICPEKKGAHNPTYIIAPNIDLYAGFSPQSGIRLVTLAPEIPGAAKVIEQLLSQGVCVSAGHSNATFEQAIIAFNQGVRYGTHLFNAMSDYHQHHPGLAGALLDDKRMRCGLIADGIHVHPALIRMIWKTIGADRLTLVTDAIAALGCEPGEYQLSDLPVVVDKTSVRLKDGTLAGSILSSDQAVRNLLLFTGCSIGEAFQTITLNPARLLGMENKIGQIIPGAHADLVLLSDALEIALTIIYGEVVYRN